MSRPCRSMALLTDMDLWRYRENAYQPTTHVSRTARRFSLHSWEWRELTRTSRGNPRFKSGYRGTRRFPTRNRARGSPNPPTGNCPWSSSSIHRRGFVRRCFEGCADPLREVEKDPRQREDCVGSAGPASQGMTSVLSMPLSDGSSGVRTMLTNTWQAKSYLILQRRSGCERWECL